MRLRSSEIIWGCKSLGLCKIRTNFEMILNQISDVPELGEIENVRMVTSKHNSSTYLGRNVTSMHSQLSGTEYLPKGISFSLSNIA